MALFQPKQEHSTFRSVRRKSLTSPARGHFLRQRDVRSRARRRCIAVRSRAARQLRGGVVMKRGTATVSARELSDAVTSDHDTSVETHLQEGPAQGRRRTSGWKLRTSGRISFRTANYSMPWPRPGPRNEQSRSRMAVSICCTSVMCGLLSGGEGSDRLVVAVNDNPSAMWLKGPGPWTRPRPPIAPSSSPSEKCDYVTVFSEATLWLPSDPRARWFDGSRSGLSSAPQDASAKSVTPSRIQHAIWSRGSSGTSASARESRANRQARRARVDVRPTRSAAALRRALLRSHRLL